MALGRTNRLPEAIDCLQRAVQLNPRLADVQSNLGVALNLANRTAESFTHFGEALRIKPEFAQAQANLEAAQKHVPQPH